MTEQNMKDFLQEFGSKGNVIISKDVVSTDVGEFAREERRTIDGDTYNIYIGAKGTWVNKGDGGFCNWAFTENFDRISNGTVVFK